MSPPATEYRMRLNNLLQADGSSGRLSWGKPIQDGPDDRPIWTIVAYLDGREVGRGTEKSLNLAKEEAARQVLKHLLAPCFAC